MKIYYNTTKQCLVDEFNCQINNKPMLFFGEKPVWQLQLYQGEVGLEPEKANVSHVVSWSSAVDVDWDNTSAPMCRTPSGIDASESSEGLLGIPMNANTISFLNKIEKKRSCEGYWEVRGYDSIGNIVMIIIIGIICHNSIDHNGGAQLDEPENNIASKAWVEAMLSGKVNAADVYTKNELDSMWGTIETQLAEI